ncbi:MAG: GHMP kinase [Cardiobacteriaceae bacterium]|nr:GHMP kinase [Cardiobacteriaceae bacterium]
MLSAQAPGKIIITGEHAVVYGAPALVCAVPRYTTVSYQPHPQNHLDTLLTGISRARYPLSALKSLKHKLDKRFEAFLRGDLPVQHILHRPDDLLAYTLASLARKVANHLPLPYSGKLHTQSALPLGAGMGSSAAAIAATLVLTEHLLQSPLSLEERFEHVRFCERLQHGKGSAIDAAAVVFGGLQKLENGERQSASFSLNEHWYYWLDGIPQASTGECVAQVRAQFGQDKALWQSFETIINELLQTLTQGNNPQSALRENQKLLQHIGVVPEATAKCIANIEASGGAAKISGAGSVRGNFGGILLIYHENPEALAKLIPPKALWGKLTPTEYGAQLIT